MNAKKVLSDTNISKITTKKETNLSPSPKVADGL